MISFRSRILFSLPVVVLACTLRPAPAQAQFTQQGPKLVGTGAVGDASQGNSVSLAGDGNTAIMGGPADNGSVGAAWVFTRAGGVWSQQAELVATDAVCLAEQGSSVSLSDDGNTAIVGGPFDNNAVGAAWVFTRSGGVWSQQAKLVGTGAVGPLPAEQGFSVSLSGDGNTALVGGVTDNNSAGAAWVFTLSGGVWGQQAKLVGTGAIGPSDKAIPCHCRATGTPPSRVGLLTTVVSAPPGCSPARAGCGASKRNWSARVR
jgi:hypothetical protein